MTCVVINRGDEDTVMHGRKTVRRYREKMAIGKARSEASGANPADTLLSDL